MKSKLFSILKYVLGWPLSVAVFFFIARLILTHTSTLTSQFTTPNFLLFLFGIIFFLLYFFLRAYLWRELLVEKGKFIPLRESTFLWEFCEIKRFVPGNIWAFVSRTVVFGEKGVSKRIVASAILLEAEFFVLASLFLSQLSIPTIIQTLIPNSFLRTFLLIGIPLVSISIVCFYIYSSFLTKKILHKHEFLPHLLPHFDAKTNTRLFCISLVTFFCFGLGSYFTVLSVVALPMQLVFPFISFFIFAFLVGYVSVVTPMGLGVREAVITLGLSHYISLPLAGFSAVYLRIVSILVELLFFFISYCLKRIKNISVVPIEKMIKRNPYTIVLLVFVFSYFCYFSSASFLRHDNFYTGRFDLGNMAQTVWNTAHGRIFQFTDPDGTEEISRLGFHADFILILLAPLQFLWSDPKMLLLIQTIALSFGAIVVFFLSERIINKKPISLAMALAFLFNPSIEFTNLYDFHAVTLATTLLLISFYFLLVKRYWWFLIFAILSALTKEEVWLIVSFFGLFIALIEKRRAFGFFLFLFSFAIFYFLIWYAIPHVRGSEHFAISYFHDYGTSPTGILKTLLFSPLKTIALLTSQDKIFYLVQLFAPLGFFSLLNPLLLLFAFPDLLINLLSENIQLHQIYYQYTATITPFLFISALYGIAWIRQKFPRISPSIIAVYIILAITLSVYFFGPLPGTMNPNIDMFTKPQSKKTIINHVLAQIPRRASVAATNNLGSHLSHRKKIFTIPIGVEKADYLAFLLNDQFAQPSLQAQITLVQNLKNNPRYEILFQQDDFIVFKKLSM